MKKILSGHRLLEFSSVVYLAIPLIIFALGWLKLYYAIPIVGVVLFLLWRTVKLPAASSKLFSFRKHKLLLSISVLVIFVWVALSGVGGFTTQTTDYNKHNAVMNDLIEKEWPVTYAQSNENNKPLVYYIAYYLPAATVGKVTHNNLAVNVAQLLWTFIGVSLVFYWILRLIKKPTYLALGVFILFSGMDIIGHILLFTHDNTNLLISSQMEWYTGLGNIQFSSNTTLLYWVPQHAIGGWLIAALLLSFIVEKRSKAVILFIFVLSVLWSPLVTIGLVPLLLGALIAERGRLRPFFTLENILSIILLSTPLLLYLLSAGSAQPHGTFLDYSIQQMSNLQKYLTLFVFIAVEFGLLAIALTPYVLKRETKEWKIIFFISITSLLAFAVVRYGIFNDLAMRASIPSLFVLMVILIRFLSFNSPSLKEFKTKAIVYCFVALGIVVPLIEINTHLLSPHKEMKDQVVEVWYSIGDNNLSPQEKKFTAQYIGKDTSLFFRYLSR